MRDQLAAQLHAKAKDRFETGEEPPRIIPRPQKLPAKQPPNAHQTTVTEDVESPPTPSEQLQPEQVKDVPIPKTRSTETKATVGSHEDMHEDEIETPTLDPDGIVGPLTTDTKDEQKEAAPPLKSNDWRKPTYKFALFLIFMYAGIIGGLGFYLFKIREANSEKENQEPPSSSPTSIPTIWDFSLRPSPQDSAPPSLSLVPTTSGPTREPSMHPTVAPTKEPSKAPTKAPTKSPSSNPTQTPSRNPTFSPTPKFYAEEKHFRRVMDRIDPSIWWKAQVVNSPQQKAMKWLIADPNFSDYLDRRIIQRFALAVTKMTITRTPKEALDSSWMEYTNECTWFTSWYLNTLACDGDDHFRHLILRNLGMDGTIPEELTLLTRLRFLILTANQLEGTLPERIGDLTALTKLHLNGNRLIGTLPSSFKQLTRLDDLVIDGNSLTGVMVPDLCNFNMTVRQADCDKLWCTCCTNCMSLGPLPVP